MTLCLLCSLVLGCSVGQVEPVFDSGSSVASDEFNASPKGDVPHDDGTCATVDVEATEQFVPVDVIWVVDSSTSMTAEAAEIQAKLSDFSHQIVASGVDVRTVVIADRKFVNVPEGLAKGSDRFKKVNYPVNSHDALMAALYAYPEYKDTLREGAATHVVFVSDDESSLSAGCFLESMTALLGKQPIVHAVASPSPGGTELKSVACSCAGQPYEVKALENRDLLLAEPCAAHTLPREGACQGASVPGRTYQALAKITGGRFESICGADWDALFEKLFEEVVEGAPLPCEVTLPATPEGLSLDASRLVVEYSPGNGGEPVLIGRDETGACEGEGFRITAGENSSTVLTLCPRTCQSVASDSDGALTFELYCEAPLL